MLPTKFISNADKPQPLDQFQQIHYQNTHVIKYMPVLVDCLNEILTINRVPCEKKALNKTYETAMKTVSYET